MFLSYRNASNVMKVFESFLDFPSILMSTQKLVHEKDIFCFPPYISSDLKKYSRIYFPCDLLPNLFIPLLKLTREHKSFLQISLKAYAPNIYLFSLPFGKYFIFIKRESTTYESCMDACSRFPYPKSTPASRDTKSPL